MMLSFFMKTKKKKNQQSYWEEARWSVLLSDPVSLHSRAKPSPTPVQVTAQDSRNSAVSLEGSLLCWALNAASGAAALQLCDAEALRTQHPGRSVSLSNHCSQPAPRLPQRHTYGRSLYPWVDYLNLTLPPNYFTFLNHWIAFCICLLT